MADFNKVLTPGDYEKGELNVVIEIPTGSNHKIEWDREHACFMLDRVEPMAFAKPCNYTSYPRYIVILWDNKGAKRLPWLLRKNSYAVDAVHRITKGRADLRYLLSYLIIVIINIEIFLPKQIKILSAAIQYDIISFLAESQFLAGGYAAVNSVFILSPAEALSTFKGVNKVKR